MRAGKTGGGAGLRDPENMSQGNGSCSVRSRVPFLREEGGGAPEGLEEAG